MLARTRQQDLKLAFAIAYRFTRQAPGFDRLRLVARKDMALTVAAGNGNEFVHLRLAAEVEAPGEVYVPARMAANLVAILPPGSVSLRANGTRTLHVESGREASRLQVDDWGGEGIPGEKASGRELARFSLAAPDWREALRHVLYAAAKDESRPALAGVYLDTSGDQEVQLVATDGYRLALTRLSVAVEGPSVILPAKSLMSLQRLLPDEGAVQVAIYGDEEPTRVVFRFHSSAFQEIAVAVPVIDAPFPDVSRIVRGVEEPTTVVHFSPGALVLPVKRADIFHQERSRGMVVTVDAEEGHLRIDVDTLDGHYHDVLRVRARGESLRVGFNPRFVRDALDALRNEQSVRLVLTGAARPAFFLPLDSDVPLCAVMPMRLQQEGGQSPQGEGSDAGVSADSADGNGDAATS